MLIHTLLCRGRKIPRPAFQLGNRDEERPRAFAVACKVGLLHHWVGYSVPSRQTIIGMEIQVPWCIIKAKHEGTLLCRRVGAGNMDIVNRDILLFPLISVGSKANLSGLEDLLMDPTAMMELSFTRLLPRGYPGSLLEEGTKPAYSKV